MPLVRRSSPIAAHVAIRRDALFLDVEETSPSALATLESALAAAVAVMPQPVAVLGPIVLPSYAPPKCYGRVVSPEADGTLRRAGLHAGCRAAAQVFLAGGYRLDLPRTLGSR
jgi:hypothetical protein